MGGPIKLLTCFPLFTRLKYRVDGKEKLAALGVYPTVSLLAARKARDAIKDQLRAGLDPTHEKRRVKLEAGLRRTNSFEAIARETKRRIFGKFSSMRTTTRRGTRGRTMIGPSCLATTRRPS